MDKRASLILLFVSLIAYSQPVQYSSGLSAQSVVQASSPAHKEKNKTLLSNSKEHVFSDSQSRDTFRIVLKGETLLDAAATLTIMNPRGVEIYREEFPARYLIGYEIVEENPTEEQQEEVIKRRVDGFFQDKNFKSPAITADEVLDEEYTDKDIWQDIKSDRTAVGFYFMVGEEDMRWIAYAKKQGKVVLYHTCC